MTRTTMMMMRESALDAIGRRRGCFSLIADKITLNLRSSPQVLPAVSTLFSSKSSANPTCNITFRTDQNVVAG